MLTPETVAGALRLHVNTLEVLAQHDDVPVADEPAATTAAVARR
ncbi:hypothetical protein [Streptomyces sp. SLBN-31]|nr:hypothetical protein [Streptomyces sp. SLBN-31]